MAATSSNASSASGRCVILGSGSPRRREILASLGVAYVVHVAAVDEDVFHGETPEGYLVRVVRAKLEAVRAALPDALRARASAVLVADTSVIVAGHEGPAILGKPVDAAEALRMIEQLAGATHEVHTRFAIASVSLTESPGAFLHEETVRTWVTFRTLTPARARAYAESGEGLDKAGGYAVQGMGAAFVARIDGSYSNVVGLPACEVAVALEQLGLR
jgi:septum formation protein